jgi:adenylosuccinate lyase
MRDAIDLLLPKLAKVIWNLAKFAVEWKAEPTLAYTHLQPGIYSKFFTSLKCIHANFPIAQLITVGKRAAQWAQDLLFDLEAIEHVRSELKFRGAQGTTGTQASFLEIFNGDASKCDALNDLLCKKTGFPSCYDVSTQTYTRKVDLIVANAIAGLGASAEKITGDIRHLAAWKEMEEPFEKDQIGSSAMAYKRNPMRSERICSLSRVLMSKPMNFANTLADQWMERTLGKSILV